MSQTLTRREYENLRLGFEAMLRWPYDRQMWDHIAMAPAWFVGKSYDPSYVRDIQLIRAAVKFMEIRIPGFPRKKCGHAQHEDCCCEVQS